MTYDEWKLATPPTGEPLELSNYCDCGVRIRHDEAFCDDCLCEMEDPRPIQKAIQSTVYPDIIFNSINDWRQYIANQKFNL